MLFYGFSNVVHRSLALQLTVASIVSKKSFETLRNANLRVTASRRPAQASEVLTERGLLIMKIH